MRTFIGHAIVLFATCALVCAQAAVEGAMTHGMAGTTSSAAGKALGNIGDRLAGKLGQQTSTALNPSAPAVRTGVQKIPRVPPTKAPSMTGSSNGSLIASIQGGEAQPAPCAASKDGKKPAPCAPKVADESHPSEITLPAPK